MPFFGTVTERAFWAKIQSTDTYKLMQCCVVDFPPEKVLVPRFGFLVRFADKNETVMQGTESMIGME